MPVPTRLKVLRPTADPKTFQTVGDSGLETIVGGPNTFETRILVEAGDRLGLFSPSKEPAGTVYCKGAVAGNTIGGFTGDIPLGSPAMIAEEVEAALPVAGVIEPDADKDGFGDETQDKCPQSATVQTTCPPLAPSAPLVLDALGLARKGAVSVLVAASLQTPVTVDGAVKLPGGSKQAHSSAAATLTAPSQTVVPGAIAVFKLRFPKVLKATLAKLPRRKSLTVRVTARGQNPAGAVTIESLAVKLRGRG